MRKRIIKIVLWFVEKLQTFLARRGMHVTVSTLMQADADGYCGPNAQSFIGELKDAMYYALRGIRPEKADETDNVCSIGFCEKEQKWYGWSHRAIYGFGIGSEVEEGDCCASSGWTDKYLEEHPEEKMKILPVGFKARSLEDTKRMAIVFAESVG